MTLRQRQPREYDGAHLAWIRTLPCVVCGDDTSTEAAHIRYSDARAAKRNVGKSEKPDDRWTLPLCGQHHRAQHETSEREFWKHLGVDPIFLALALSCVSGDHAAGVQIIEASR
jgi:HNH endonuclease